MAEETKLRAETILEQYLDPQDLQVCPWAQRCIFCCLGDICRIVLAVRKSARIGERLQKKQKQQQGTQVIPSQNKRTEVRNKNITDSEKRQRRKKGQHVSSPIIRRTAKVTLKAAVKSNVKASPKTPIKASSKTAIKASPKTPIKASPKTPIKASSKTAIKASPKTPIKASSKTPLKAVHQAPSNTNSTTKAKPQTPAATVKVTKKGSDKTSTNSSDKSSSDTSAKRTAKRKANETASPNPSGSKKAKTFGTPSTTPRRSQEQTARRKPTKKKAKNSPVQFDYGVPSPTETERESVEDEDSPSQLQARAAQRVVVAVTKQDQSVRIALDPPKAFTFKSEQARKLWEAATKERAELVKGVIESTDFVPDWLKRQLEGSLELSAAQKRAIITEDKNRRAQGMLGVLKLEEKALDLDAEIKLSLRKEFADTDVERCIECIDKLLTLPVDPLTLKKYPHLAMTPCSLQRYRGALAQWTLSSQQEELFCSKREIIWEKAKALQQKYMTLFGIDDAEKYVEVFNQRVQRFQDSVSNLSEEEISLLVHDPSSKKHVRKKVSLT